jgi:phosphatidylglycerol---prolipoprotein diacylglyceryl transferase
MLEYPSIDPVLLSLGPLQVRWYGLMYVIGFTAAYLLVMHQAKRFRWQRMLNHVDNLNLILILGVVIGGRLGYVLFYNPAYYFPILLKYRQYGLAACPSTAVAWGRSLPAFSIAVAQDLISGKPPTSTSSPSPSVFFSAGLAISSTVNCTAGSQLFPWAMVFPQGGPLPRHPSQLYEALLEGLVLFLILWTMKAKPWHPARIAGWPHGIMLALFLGLYGFFRFMVEFVREPDPQIGLIGSTFSMGQVLCLLMICAGILLWLGEKRRQQTIQPVTPFHCPT